MVLIHQGTPSELLRDLIMPGREPVTLICPILPPVDILDQAVVAVAQHDRQLRVVTSLYGSGPGSARDQIESMIRLERVGARVKSSERSVLPSLLLVPPAGCVILPAKWGYFDAPWHRPLIIDNSNSDELFQLGDKIWRQAGSYAGSRRLRTALRWLEEIVDDSCMAPEQLVEVDGEVHLSTLTLFDKPRGRRNSLQRKGKANGQAWWTFHGTADERVNPFLPVRVWAQQRGTHTLIRFPRGKRPTGVNTGDWVFFVLHSREPGGEPEMYIVGRAKALAYRPLIDDLDSDSADSENFISRYPHALRLESVQLIGGAVGEGVSVHSLMLQLGPAIFKSTSRNVEKHGGNVDPRKSITQKSMILLSEKGLLETNRLLELSFRRLGCMPRSEITATEN
jgi:hypothetical protein